MLINEKLDKKILEFKQLDKKGKKVREEEIINSKDPKAIYEFAKNVEGAHIDKLEDGIIATGEAKYIYEFARHVKGARIDKLEDGIITTGEAEYIYEFAAKIRKGKDIDKLEDGIIATRNAGFSAEYIYHFAWLKGAHIDKLEDAIIATGEAYYIYYFARNIKKGKDIDKLEDAIIATRDAQYIHYFAREVKEEKDIDKLEDGIIATRNAEYIYYFVFLEGSHIDKLEDGIIATGDAEYICEFAKNVKGAHIDKLEEAIMTTGDIKSISAFLKLTNINTDKMELYLVLLKKFELKLIGKTIKESFLNKLYFGEKDATLKYLIKNREIDINEIRLRIYFDYLNNPNSTEKDLEKCNEEYIRYVSMFFGEKNKNEETKENSGTNNKKEKILVKTKKINE